MTQPLCKKCLAFVKTAGWFWVPVIFGLLNIYLAIRWWFIVPGNPLMMLPVPYAVPIGVTFWLLALAYGLFRRREWARVGTLIYAGVDLAWGVAVFALYMTDVVNAFMLLPGGGPIYSFLLIVLLRLKRVKREFEEIRAS